MYFLHFRFGTVLILYRRCLFLVFKQTSKYWSDLRRRSKQVSLYGKAIDKAFCFLNLVAIIYPDSCLQTCHIWQAIFVCLPNQRKHQHILKECTLRNKNSFFFFSQTLIEFLYLSFELFLLHLGRKE